MTSRSRPWWPWVVLCSALVAIVAIVAPRSSAQRAAVCASLEAAFVDDTTRAPADVETALHTALRRSDACVAHMGRPRGPLSTILAVTFDAEGALSSVTSLSSATHARPAFDRCIGAALRGAGANAPAAGQTYRLWIDRRDERDGVCERAPLSGYRYAISDVELVEGADTGVVAGLRRRMLASESYALLPDPFEPFVARLTIDPGGGHVSDFASDAPPALVAPLREWFSHTIPEVLGQSTRIVVELTFVARPVPPRDDDGAALAPVRAPPPLEPVSS